MRITDITLDRLRLELDPPFHAAWDPDPRTSFDATIVRVHTDAGLVGIGSGDTMDGFEAFAHLFVGTDPTQVLRHVRTLETIDFHAGRYWPLEAALWDLAGQAWGVPVSHLFGGTLDQVAAYASTGELKTPEARVESALAAREAGFRAMKLRIDRDRLDEGVDVVTAVREAVGDDLDLMVDLNQSWRMAGDTVPALDPAAVRRTVERLGELGVTWVEEPLPYTEAAGLADLRRATGVPIAGGEMLRTFDDVLRLMDADALDIFQMDVVLATGLHRTRLAAELALHRHRRWTPHTWSNGIGLLANLHVALGVGAAPYLEFPWDPPGWTPERRDFMLAEPVTIDDEGFLAVPDRPGLGVVLDEEAVERWRIS